MIVAGHGSLYDINEEDIKALTGHSCSKVASVGCFANFYNRDSGIPNLPVNVDDDTNDEDFKFWKEYFGNNHPERDDTVGESLLPKYIDLTIEAAKKAISCGCDCKEMKIEVYCKDIPTKEADSKNKRKAAKNLHPDTSLDPKCGEIYTYDCKTQKWDK